MHLSSAFDEDTARRVLLVQAFETLSPPPAVWTLDDRVWASRLARDSMAAETPPVAALRERSQHALHRLLPRDPLARRALAFRAWHPSWPVWAAVLALGLGLLLDLLGGSQRINLLAPPVWGVIAWNVCVYGLLGLSSLVGRMSGQTSGRSSGRFSDLRGRFAHWRLRALPAARQHPALLSYFSAWGVQAAPLLRARCASLMHVAAAALACGLMLSLYLRGLVLDFRVGWESTFLGEDAVQQVLQFLLFPAVWLTGISVPDAATLQSLRVAPGAAAVGPAAPWIHLYATMLLLLVVVPRTLLALACAWRARWLSTHLRLPLQAPYFQGLLREMRGSNAVVQVLPQGAAPTPQTTLGLRTWLMAALGEGTQLHFAPATPYGQEEQAAGLQPPPGTSLRLLLVDLGATPEADTQGRLLQVLRQAAPGLPVLVLADSHDFEQRFGHLPTRLQQRRTLWREMARSRQCGFLSLDLQAPPAAQAQQELQAALALGGDTGDQQMAAGP